MKNAQNKWHTLNVGLYQIQSIENTLEGLMPNFVSMAAMKPINIKPSESIIIISKASCMIMVIMLNVINKVKVKISQKI